MIHGGETSLNSARRWGRAAVDGLIIGGKEVWILVGRPGEDVAGLLRPGPGLDEDSGSALLVCRGVLEGGVLLLGDADPERDPLLSDLIRAKDEDRA